MISIHGIILLFDSTVNIKEYSQKRDKSQTNDVIGCLTFILKLMLKYAHAIGNNTEQHTQATDSSLEQDRRVKMFQL